MGRHDDRGLAEAERVLRGAWGRDFDRNLGLVQAEIARHPGLGAYLDATGLGNNARLAGFLLQRAQARGGR